MQRRHRLRIVTALGLVLTGACSPTPDSGDTRAEPAVKEVASVPQVQPVTLPDLSRLPSPVQEQIRKGQIVLDQAIERHAPAEELGRAYGDVGLLLMAADIQAPAEACLRNAQTLASTDPRWSYYLGQLYLASGERAKASESFERVLKLRPTDFPTLVRLAEPTSMKIGRTPPNGCSPRRWHCSPSRRWRWRDWAGRFWHEVMPPARQRTSSAP